MIHLAARVGGLFANMQAKVEFFQDNIAINDNVIRLSYKFKIRKLVCCLSTCIYPETIGDYSHRDYHVYEETEVHLGPPHPSNEGYAYAKRMCEVQCRLYREQYGCNFVCVVPTNLYGPFDSYSESKSHVVAALIRRAHACTLRGEKVLEVYGTGKPLRQLCFAPDLALLMLFVAFNASNDIAHGLISLLPEEEYTIEQVAKTIA